MFWIILFKVEACKFFSPGRSTWGKSWRSEERGKIGRTAVSIDEDLCQAELKQKLSFYQSSSLCARSSSTFFNAIDELGVAHCTVHNPQHDLHKVGRSRAGIDSILQRLERMVRHPQLMVLFLNIDYHTFQDVARPMIGSAKKLKLSYRFAS